MVDPKVIEIKNKAKMGEEITQEDCIKVFEIVKREFAKAYGIKKY